MSDSGASTTVPPGVGQDDNQNPQIILSITAVLVLALACVGLRLFARLSRTGVTGPGLGIDDYAVLVATVSRGPSHFCRTLCDRSDAD